jgi:hypothetical protein
VLVVTAIILFLLVYFAFFINRNDYPGTEASPKKAVLSNRLGKSSAEVAYLYGSLDTGDHYKYVMCVVS